MKLGPVQRTRNPIPSRKPYKCNEHQPLQNQLAPKYWKLLFYRCQQYIARLQHTSFMKQKSLTFYGTLTLYETYYCRLKKLTKPFSNSWAVASAKICIDQNFRALYKSSKLIRCASSSFCKQNETLTNKRSYKTHRAFSITFFSSPFPYPLNFTNLFHSVSMQCSGS